MSVLGSSLCLSLFLSLPYLMCLPGRSWSLSEPLSMPISVVLAWFSFVFVCVVVYIYVFVFVFALIFPFLFIFVFALFVVFALCLSLVRQSLHIYPYLFLSLCPVCCVCVWFVQLCLCLCFCICLCPICGVCFVFSFICVFVFALFVVFAFSLISVSLYFLQCFVHFSSKKPTPPQTSPPPPKGLFCDFSENHANLPVSGRPSSPRSYGLPIHTSGKTTAGLLQMVSGFSLFWVLAL